MPHKNLTLEGLTADHALDTFACSDEGIQRWLRNAALGEQKGGRSRTFVAVDDDGVVLAYVTNAMVEIKGKGLDKKLVGSEGRPCQGFLIAKLGVHDDYQQQGVGTAVLSAALRMIALAADVVGGRLVIVDFKTKELDDYYAARGFEYSVTPTRRALLVSTLVESLGSVADGERPA